MNAALRAAIPQATTPSTLQPAMEMSNRTIKRDKIKSHPEDVITIRRPADLPVERLRTVTGSDSYRAIPRATKRIELFGKAKQFLLNRRSRKSTPRIKLEQVANTEMRAELMR